MMPSPAVLVDESDDAVPLRDAALHRRAEPNCQQRGRSDAHIVDVMR